MAYCSNCGIELKPNARFCHACGTAVGATAGPAGTAAPQPAQPRTDAAPSHEQTAYIGLGPRFAAHLIDGVVVLVLFWIIGSRIAAKTGGTTETGFELHGGPALTVIMITLIAAILYFTLTEGVWNGQSLGKKLLHIKVVGEDGSPCSFTQALTRNVVRLVDAFALYLVGIVMVLRSPKKQRLGDRIAHTVVVAAPKRARAEAPSKEKTSSVHFSMGKGSGYLDT